MSPPPPNPAAPSRAEGSRPSKWVWVVVVLCIGLPSLLLYGVVSSFSLGRDAAALRDAVHPGGGLELRLGNWALGGLRAGAGYLDAEPEVQNLLGSLNRIECGVYSMPDGQGTSPGDLLKVGDEAMKSRGWSRVVGVTRAGDVVGVYTRDAAPEADEVSLCLLVCHEEHLVIGGARCRVDRLMGLFGEEGLRFARGRESSDGHPRMF